VRFFLDRDVEWRLARLQRHIRTPSDDRVERLSDRPNERRTSRKNLHTSDGKKYANDGSRRSFQRITRRIPTAQSMRERSFDRHVALYAYVFRGIVL